MSAAVQLPAQQCPSCGTWMDGASRMVPAGSGPTAPEPDDLTVCIYCGTVLVFGPSLCVRAATLDELVDRPQEHRDAISAIQRFIRSGYGPKPKPRPAAPEGPTA